MDYLTIYDKSSGAIKRVVGLFNPKDAAIQCSDGEGYVWGNSDPERDEVVAAKIVRKSRDLVEQIDVSKAWVELRLERKSRLLSSDWTQVSDAPVDQQAWATYRQALRDLPSKITDPREVVWPETPNS